MPISSPTPISWKLFRSKVVSNTLKECIIILPVQVWKLREKQFIWEIAQNGGNEDPEPQSPDSECCV